MKRENEKKSTNFYYINFELFFLARCIRHGFAMVPSNYDSTCILIT